MDDYEGDTESPASLHKYTYANADPVDNVDPGGQESEAEALGGLGGSLTVQTIALVNYLKVLGFVASGILVGVGLASEIDVIRASRAQSQQLTQERTRVKTEVESQPRPRNAKILFHYTDQGSAELIAADGELVSYSRGTYGFGNYAPDIAGWLAESVMRRSQLTTMIFGRNIPGTYAQTAWFVAFIETPRAPFRKVAPFIYLSPQSVTPIIPLYVGPTLLGE